MKFLLALFLTLAASFDTSNPFCGYTANDFNIIFECPRHCTTNQQRLQECKDKFVKEGLEATGHACFMYWMKSEEYEEEVNKAIDDYDSCMLNANNPHQTARCRENLNNKLDSLFDSLMKSKDEISDDLNKEMDRIKAEVIACLNGCCDC